MGVCPGPPNGSSMPPGSGAFEQLVTDLGFNMEQIRAGSGVD